nr:hypothetical protein [Tanacetum cinerariifolium]
MHKAFPLPAIKFPPPEELPTASEDGSHCQKKRDVTARKIALLSMSRRNCQSNMAVTLTKGSETLEQTFNRLQVIIGQLQFMDVEVEDDDLNQKFLTSLALEWMIHTIVWRSRSDLDTMSLDDLYNHLKSDNNIRRSLINNLQQVYGNFKAEGSETLEQTFNRLQVIIGQLQFMDVEVEDDDLNQKFLTSLALEWMIHTIVWRNRSDLDTMSLDDLYNHLKVYESEVQKKSKPNSQNMAFISSSKHSSENEDGNTSCVPTASINVPTASASVATICQDTACAYIASQSSDSQIKFKDINQIDKDDIEEMDIKWNMALLRMRVDKFWKKTGKKISIQGSNINLDNLIESQRSGKNKDGLGYSVVPPPPAQLYLSLKKDLSWTGLLEFADDTVTDYSRPS